jgi:hypothetical protein
MLLLAFVNLYTIGQQDEHLLQDGKGAAAGDQSKHETELK